MVFDWWVYSVYGNNQSGYVLFGWKYHLSSSMPKCLRNRKMNAPTELCFNIVEVAVYKQLNWTAADLEENCHLLWTLQRDREFCIEGKEQIWYLREILGKPQSGMKNNLIHFGSI